MTGVLDGRVAIVTGAARGLGAAHALRLAELGAKVVVNDVASADDVVGRINESGGVAIANTSDVSSFEDAGRLVEAAIESFGGLDILVNNAGILRDRILAKMSVDEWDAVISVHLTGHFATTRHAAAYWNQTRDERTSDAVIVHTTSVSGLHGNVGQANYAVAKAGIATLARINHLEMNERLGVRVYAIAPGARTDMTNSVPQVAEQIKAPDDGRFDYYDPGNVANFVAWLAEPGCRAQSGSVYGVQGDIVRRYDAWQIATTIENGSEPWTSDALNLRLGELDAGAQSAFHSMERGLSKA